MSTDFVRARCRLIPDFWKVAAVCLLMLALFVGVAISEPPRGFEGWSSGAALFALFGATPFYWLVAVRRGCIEFDADGARWRTAFGNWKSARWDEIEGVDTRTNATGGKIAHWKFVVHTRAGDFSWTNRFENAADLAPLAARFRPLIPADAETWPRRFDYRGAENLVLPLACLFLAIMFFGAIAKWLIGAERSYLAAQFAIYVELYGWLLTLAGFALFGALIFVVPALIFSLYFNLARQSWRCRDDIFVATTDGLSWRIQGRERLFAAWDELQILHVEARGRLISLPHFRLQSARGEFEWAGGLSGAAQLGRICFERAPQLEREVQLRLSEELQPMPIEAGEVLTFDFKTRSWRAMLWLPAICSVGGWASVIWGPFQPPNDSEPMPIWLIAIFATLATMFTLYGVQLFRRGCIVLDARGIRWDLPFRKQFIAWSEIDGLIADRKPFLQTGARRVPLGTHDMYPTRLDLLLQTIAARATRAGGAWKAADGTVISLAASPADE